MAYILEDRIAETSTSTGTGNITLAGAITGYRAFSSVCANNDTLPYVIQGVDGSGVATGEWETGLGTWTTGGILVRTTVYRSSNANALVTFSAGSKQVFLTLLANDVKTGVFNSSGLAVLDFSTGNIATTTISGANFVLPTSKIFVDIDPTPTSLHSEDEHMMLRNFLGLSVPRSGIVTGTSFKIVGTIEDKSLLNGTINVKWMAT